LGFGIGIKTKMMAIAVVPITAIAVIAIVSWLSIDSLSVANEKTDHTHKMIEQALTMDVFAREMESVARGYLLTGKIEFLEAYSKKEKEFESTMADLRKKLRTQSQVELLDKIGTFFREWSEATQTEIAMRQDLSKSKTMDDVSSLVMKHESKMLMERIGEMYHAFIAREEALLKVRARGVESTEINARRVLFWGTFTALLMALATSYLMAGSFTRPILESVKLAEAIGNGDLTHTIEVRCSDEIGKLGSALNNMTDNLRKQTNRIMETINFLTSAASELAATVSQLATSASQTSSAVAQATSNTEQVKQSARVASEKANTVAQGAQEAVRAAESGRNFTDATMNRMGLIKDQMESIGETVVRLSEHSRQIEDIIATVQDLADQSNLLAVNASIEAARAGDHGKGFAVVAQEIKSLADQSRQATGQVRSVLVDTQKWVSAVVVATEQGGKAVQSGVEQSVQTGDSIGVLSDHVASSYQSANFIKASSEQQFLAVDQVSVAMMSIEQAMRQIKGSADQLDAAAQRSAYLSQDPKNRTGVDSTRRPSFKTRLPEGTKTVIPRPTLREPWFSPLSHDLSLHIYDLLEAGTAL
jgi:methyl-accepting chemotaxis protein